MELFERSVAEAGAHMTDVSPCAGLAHCEDEGSKKRSGAPWRGEACDHDFLPLRGLDLEPVGCPASRGVSAGGALCHDAFEVLALGLGEELFSACLAKLAEGDQLVTRQNGPEPLLALQKR